MNARTGRMDASKPLLLIAAAAAVIFFLAQFGNSPDLSKVKSISATEARQLIDEGALVIDVRGREAYGGRHIPGSISVPLEVLRKAIPEVIAREKAKPIVVYCGDGVTIGPTGTAVLNAAGYANAVNLGAGIQGWADAGYPVDKSAPGT